MCYDKIYVPYIKENLIGGKIADFILTFCLKMDFKIRNLFCLSKHLLKFTYLRVSSEELKGLVHLPLFDTSP